MSDERSSEPHSRTSPNSVPDLPFNGEHIKTPPSYYGAGSNPSLGQLSNSDGTAYTYHTRRAWHNRETESPSGECFRPQRTDVQPEFGSCPTCMGAITSHRFGLHSQKLVLDAVGSHHYPSSGTIRGINAHGVGLARLRQDPYLANSILIREIERRMYKPTWWGFFKEVWRRKLKV